MHYKVICSPYNPNVNEYLIMDEHGFIVRHFLIESSANECVKQLEEQLGKEQEVVSSPGKTKEEIDTIFAKYYNKNIEELHNRIDERGKFRREI